MNTRLLDVLRQSRLFYLPYLIVVITCIILKLNYSRADIYFAVNGHHAPWADELFPYVTDAGTEWMVVPICIYFLCTSYRKFLLFGSSLAITGILAQIIKHIFHSPRPKAYFAGELGRIYFVKGVDILTRNSFPSGHTVTAFCAATVLAYLAVNKRWGFIFLLLAMLVGFSRMYLSEHFFEDVTAGSIISVMATVMWLTWLDGRAFLHSQKWNRGLVKR